MIHADKYRRKVDPVQKCTEIIEAALKEYDCILEVGHLVKVVPKPK